MLDIFAGKSDEEARELARERYMTTTELVQDAQRSLDTPTWDYVAGATESETTLKRNRQGIDQLALRPRVMRDISSTDLTTEFLGQKLRLPLLFAPVGGLQTIHPIGAVGPAAVAHDFGIFYMQSSVTEPGMEEIQAAAQAYWLFQLYVFGDFDFIADYINRTTDLGVKAFCVTVDSAHYSRRERNLINRYNAQGGGGRGTRGRGDPIWREHFDWGVFDKMRAMTDLPLILKGISRPEDAALAVEHGCDVVYVSNHGGRQLDHGLGTIHVLPEIVEAVNGKAKIVIDGGFMRGTDIIKALILGADLVGLGKIQAMALGAAGQAGVHRLLEILELEMTIDMKLLGVNNYAELDQSFIAPAQPTVEPSVFSTMPLMKYWSAKDKSEL